jgi:paraquat-inducible protein B
LNTTHKRAADLPHARLGHHARLWLIWFVPAIAAVAAIVLVAENLQRFGPLITIEFDNANGLDANQTVVRYRGVRVGKVDLVQLEPDLNRVKVTVRLIRSAEGLARAGTVFWVVRPEVSSAGLHALETIVSGPYIEALPASGPTAGKAQKEFVGASEPPVVQQPGAGTEYVLWANQVRSLGAGSPIFYRGLSVGKVEYLDLSPDSTTVNIHVLIKPNFAPLIRSNTVWWNAGGIDINWHLLSGLSMSAENIRSMITGGISFATPNEAGPPARAGTVFALDSRPDQRWLTWAPDVAITNTAVSQSVNNTGGLDVGNDNQSPKQKQQ